ncbi:hypothetical protein B0T19DRAFT_470795 [Cercophora scortea]|uniref:Uncharacterized protein n=1 Tax=Cercophora scortea TaxID=314031 RepID=A0AAE0J262_9PEZI|nr:hypothetical protein B0T19DRAFT_470795 [Cercophora scortea]
MASTRATRGFDINSANPRANPRAMWEHADHGSPRAQRRMPNIHPFDIAARLADKAREGIAKRFRSSSSTSSVRTPVRHRDDMELNDHESDQEMEDDSPPPRYSAFGTASKRGSDGRPVRCLKELDDSMDWKHDSANETDDNSETDQAPIQCLKIKAKQSKQTSSRTAPAPDSRKMEATYANGSAAYENQGMQGQQRAQPTPLPHIRSFSLPFIPPPPPPPGLPTVVAMPTTMPVYTITQSRMTTTFVPGPITRPGHVNIRPVSDVSIIEYLSTLS